jgi:diadenylate cyclase
LKDERLIAAACVMPLTSGETMTDRQVGLRHRAALGISEVSDAVAVVVSEETGTISVAHNGRMIRRLDAGRLKHILTAFYRPRGSSSLGALWPGARARPADREKEKEVVGD